MGKSGALPDVDSLCRAVKEEKGKTMPPGSDGAPDGAKGNASMGNYSARGAERQAPSARKRLPADAWEPPQPFGKAQLPPFPTESLPGPVQAFVEALAENTQTPAEMGGLVSLGVLASAFQDKFTVEVRQDWHETLSLFLLAVASPGERKSAVLKALTHAIYAYEKERQEQEAGEIAKNRSAKRILTASLKNAEALAADIKKPQAKRDEAGEKAGALSAELANFREKHEFRLMLDNATPESLIGIMEEQGGAISLVSSEGGVFNSMLGRYEKNPDIDAYLKAHDGDPIKVDRVTREGNAVEAPKLTMALMGQPEVLRGFVGNSMFRGRGLVARFLFAACDASSRVGRRETDPADIPPSVREGYNAYVRRILSMPYRGVIRMGPEASRRRSEYQRIVEARLVGDLEHMRDWGSKITGTMCRIAALIHAGECGGDPTQAPMGAETVEAAINIAEAASAHAVEAYLAMGADGAAAGAKYLLKRLKAAGLGEISKRDLYDRCKGKFPTAESMEPALAMLADMGYVRVANKATGGRGRPGKMIILNPYEQK